MAGYLTISDNFQTRTPGQSVDPTYWDEPGNTLSTIVTTGNDGTGPHSGSQQAQCVQSNSNGLIFTSFGVGLAAYYTNEFLINGWQRFDSSYPLDGFSGGSGFHGWEFYSSSPAAEWYMTQSNVTFMQFEGHPVGGTLFNNIFSGLLDTLEDRLWHSTQYYYNHATGTYKIWFDGVLRLNTATTSTYKWNRFDFLANFGTTVPSPPGYYYIDDVQIFTDSNSLGLGSPITSGSMAGGDAVAAGGGSPQQFVIRPAMVM